MKHFRTVLQIVCVFMCSSAVVLAQTEVFTIKISGGVDTTPPSTPVLLSADPIASTQIDVSWSAATDDTVVSGYSVLRDGLPVATTTLLSYSDTGLAPSTTYSYAVRAFDPSLNYSTTSNAIATTTFAAPVSPPAASTSSSNTSGTAARVVAEEVRVVVGISTTSITVSTAHPARLEVRWGRTGSYELGYVMGSAYLREHATILTDLEPGTTYEYEIVGYTPFGQATVLKRGTFATVSGLGQSAVLNVERFSAVAAGTDVRLSWQLPHPVIDVARVRIVRSHLGFPEHPQDGAVVYQGDKESAIDTSVLDQYSPVYYTAFVYDQHGNVSSGAVAVVYAIGTSANDVSGISEINQTVGVLLPETDTATSAIDTKRFTVEMKMPSLTDVRVKQGRVMYLFTDEPIKLDAANAFTVSIPQSAVAGNLKSIIATVYHPTESDKSYSFLLRLNRDRTAYEAQISPLFVVGRSVLVVEIYDYEAFVVGTFQTPIAFIETATPVLSPVVFPDLLFVRWPLILLVFGVLSLLLVWFFLLKRRTEDNN